MKKRYLNNIKVSNIGLGCMGYSHGYGPTPEDKKSIELIQKAYEYYSAPIVLGDDKKNYGIFTFHPNVVTVVPIEPILNLADAPEDYKIDEWFIGNENGLIKYSNFIKQFDDSPLYDANHIIIKLSEEEFSDLVSKYGEDLEKLKLE